MLRVPVGDFTPPPTIIVATGREAAPMTSSCNVNGKVAVAVRMLALLCAGLHMCGAGLDQLR